MLSVLTVLSDHASSQPSNTVWTFLNDAGDIVDSYTYRELETVTDGLANYLINHPEVNAGDRVVLVFFPGLLFSVSLIACFKAGLIAVPVFPPDPRRLKKDLDHFVSIQSSSGARVVLTHAPYNYAKKMAGVKAMFTGGSAWPDMTWLPVDDVVNKEKAKVSKMKAFPPPVRRIGEVAFLQYTSGSTSEPKGVMISHQNLSHNLLIITRELAVDKSTINVSWLPQYHDMGLIGSYLGSLYCGGTGFFMSPISFLKDPTVWLRSISKYRGSHTQAPNFAYALVSRKFKESVSEGKKKSSSSAVGSSLDLSSLKHMINAAEPVDAEAISEFYATFRPFGLPTGVVVPTYGLAEHTVFVCSAGRTMVLLDKAALEAGTVSVVDALELGSTGALAERTAGSQSIVGCGIPEKGEGVSVVIVDPETRKRTQPNMVGEIWVNSPSKASGYWGKPELSEEVFQAKIEEEEAVSASASASAGPVTYLRTGDLGFMHGQELFICGRSKDLIIVRGANHYPQDIERTAERSGQQWLRAGCSAAFSVPHLAGHTETVVYVAEVKPNISVSLYPQIIETIRSTVVKEHGLPLSSVCLLEARTVEKTTSGKIARAWCRRAFLSNSLKVLSRWDGNPADPALENDVMGENGLDGEAEVATSGVTAVPGEGDALLEAKASADQHRHPKMDPTLPQDELRALSEADLAGRLERALVVVSSQGPSPLQLPLDHEKSLLSLGLDSLTIVQFKGILEKRFHLNIPDEFMFTELCTVTGLAAATKIGHLTSSQTEQFENHQPAVCAEGQGQASQPGHRNGDRSTTMDVRIQRQPWCPWFTCCY